MVQGVATKLLTGRWKWEKSDFSCYFNRDLATMWNCYNSRSIYLFADVIVNHGQDIQTHIFNSGIKINGALGALNLSACTCRSLIIINNFLSARSVCTVTSTLIEGYNHLFSIKKSILNKSFCGTNCILEIMCSASPCGRSQRALEPLKNRMLLKVSEAHHLWAS